ncbi:MAG: 50S ribosomal protein L21 [Candidatus Marinimicrobia bacterium]|nr:50S ribosomal protein L21 [Candidatus Neomarinimicrobiota bacterium]
MKSEMYAIAEIAGDQVVLETGKKISVPRLDVEEGKEFIVDSVLYYRNGNDVKIGNPTVKGVQISTVVVEHKRLPKVIVFKKKRRKGYRVKNGHRQPYTLLEVKGLSEAKKAASKPKVAPKKDSNPTETKPEAATQKE